MASLSSLRTTPFPFPFLSSTPIRITRCSSPSLLPLFSSLSRSATLTLDPSYGPSLRKGRPPPPLPFPVPPSASESTPADGAIDRGSFTRVFDLAALRVPADRCAALEGRLRGHLLNWPRIRNVARVEGDDMDSDLRRLLREGSGADEGRLQSLVRREGEEEEEERVPLSPVMYREKLAKEFNCRGFLRFRNLAKISRPKKKRKMKRKEREGNEGFEVTEMRGRNGFAIVEVVGNNGDDVEDLVALLGDGFAGGTWRGPTRLLLLDERYAGKGVEELPEAVKIALCEDQAKNYSLKLELLQCQMTLFYDYWPPNEILEALLPEGIVVPTAFETVGHIAHLNLREEHLPYKKLIARVVLDKNMPKIQTIVNKVDAIQNEYRTMELEVLAGNHSLVTTVIENGIQINVDLEKVYWNSRLATERQRLICSFSHNDVVCDAFAGVGPIAILAAKKVKYVYANDLNPTAVEYLERNIVLNKLDRKTEVFNMDGRRFIKAMFSSQQPYPITQVVMNLPNDAVEFLGAFMGIFNRRSKTSIVLPKIHVYGFSKAQDPEFDFHERIKLALCESAVEVEMHRVRLVAPGKWMLCGSFLLPEKIAFAKCMQQY